MLRSSQELDKLESDLSEAEALSRKEIKNKIKDLENELVYKRKLASHYKDKYLLNITNNQIAELETKVKILNSTYKSGFKGIKKTLVAGLGIASFISKKAFASTDIELFKGDSISTIDFNYVSALGIFSSLLYNPFLHILVYLFLIYSYVSNYRKLNKKEDATKVQKIVHHIKYLLIFILYNYLTKKFGITVFSNIFSNKAQQSIPSMIEIIEL